MFASVASVLPIYAQKLTDGNALRKRSSNMIKFESTLMTRIAGVLTTALLLSFTACANQSPFDAGDNHSDVAVTLGKRGGQGKGNQNTDDGPGNSGRNFTDNSVTFPLEHSKLFRYHSGFGYYRGGDIEFKEGSRSKLSVKDAALTPPYWTKQGDDVRITMRIDHDVEKNELIFTFGPPGCRFDPPVEIKMDYRVLGVDVVDLFYIDEQGNYIKQTPEQIDVNKQWLKIYVDHFSRYAVAWGE
jgi:hypothetical protein